MFGFGKKATAPKVTAESNVLIDVRSMWGIKSHLVTPAVYLNAKPEDKAQAICGSDSWLFRGSHETALESDWTILHIGSDKITSEHYCGSCIIEAEKLAAK